MYGFRRVLQVRVRRIGGHARAEVTGVVHRVPRTIAVPLVVATELVLAGAPLALDPTLDPPIEA